MGWTGDGQFPAPAAACFMDVHGFYRKWVTDIRDGQLEDGRFSNMAPNVYGFNFGPGWSDAGVTMPWLLHVLYGDRRVLEEQLPAARRWVDFVQAANPDGIYRNQRGGDWGDWLNGNTLLLPGWRAEACSVPKELSATAISARFHRNRGEDGRGARRQPSRRGIPATSPPYQGRLPTGVSQARRHAHRRHPSRLRALALHYGLIDDPIRHKVAARLAEAVRQPRGASDRRHHGDSAALPSAQRERASRRRLPDDAAAQSAVVRLHDREWRDDHLGALGQLHQRTRLRPPEDELVQSPRPGQRGCLGLAASRRHRPR